MALEKVIELMRRHKAKEDALAKAYAEYKAIKKEIEEEFGDTEAAVKEEKASVAAWMKANGMKSHYEDDGSVELRDSAPKYIVLDEAELLKFLAEKGMLEALSIKKSPVNDLKKQDLIPDTLVEVRVEEEVAVTTTYKKG